MPNVSDMPDDVPGIVLRPEGELDLATVEVFREQAHSALDSHPAVLLIDLSRVTFLDSSGLSVVAMTFKSQRSRSAAVALVNPQPIVRRAIELVGLDVLFDVRDVPGTMLASTGLPPA